MTLLGTNFLQKDRLHQQLKTFCIPAEPAEKNKYGLPLMVIVLNDKKYSILLT
jgi:hypothetical protein